MVHNKFTKTECYILLFPSTRHVSRLLLSDVLFLCDRPAMFEKTRTETHCRHKTSLFEVDDNTEDDTLEAWYRRHNAHV